MIRIDNIRDLERFGIDALTGESCAYHRRMLVGLTQAGADLVCDFYGINLAGLREPWNSTACGEKAVASFMLPVRHEAWTDLATVGLFRQGCPEVWQRRRARLPFGGDLFGPNGRVSYKWAKEQEPDAFVWDGVLVGVEDSDVDRMWYTAMTTTQEAGDGDIWWQDYVELLHRDYNPGRSRNQHAMTGRTV